VSRLCGCATIEIDVPDKWLKTPLHYASQRGSSICSLYLQKRGANLEALDIYENTPLAVAMLSNHHHYAILLIQTKANVKRLVHKEDHERIAKMWKEAELKERGDVEMADE
jgi:ankyrin repeat protein